MKKNFSRTKDYILKHKIISVIALIVLIIIGYQTVKAFTGSAVQTTYTLGTVKKGTIISTVSGTGQVSSLSQVDLKTQTAGTITYLNTKVGQEVSVGTLIAQLDSRDARDQLDNANLAYQKLVTVDPTTLLKDQNTVAQDTTNLTNAYVTAQATLSSSLSDMSDVSNGLNGLFDFNTGYLASKNYLLDANAKSYQSRAENSWNIFDSLLNSLTAKYKDSSSGATNSEIEASVSDFYNISLAGAKAAKDTQDAIIYLMNNDSSSKSQTAAATAYSTIVPLVLKANGAVANLSAANSSIANGKISLANATADLQNLKDGPDALSLQSAQLTINQKQEALANYSVVAPFAGVIASAANLSLGDSVGNGTTVVTLITKQKIATISLNEIDASKIKVGQKVNLTFDAVSGLNITGTVSEVDLVGTVSQGVVSYNVQITFDTQDDRIKSGMSVSASIITEAKVDVLTVPASAVKTQADGTNYVEIPGAKSTDTPTPQVVTVGISNDTLTEIVSGLKEGDSIVTKTTTVGTVTTAKTTASISSLLGGNRRPGN